MNYRDTWINMDGKIVKSEHMPDDGDRWLANVNLRRVHGANYTPYTGTGSWVREANRRLADDAQSNFAKR
jgi:hypothetical protein